VYFSQDKGRTGNNKFIDRIHIWDASVLKLIRTFLHRVPLVGGRFTFPFVTIESVDVSNPTTGQIIVVNDNNLPFSAGELYRLHRFDVSVGLSRVSCFDDSECG
jgi:hypothetical protein